MRWQDELATGPDIISERLEKTESKNEKKLRVKICQTCGKNVDRPTGNFCKACRNAKQNQSRTSRNKTTREIEQERSEAAAFNNKLLTIKW